MRVRSLYIMIMRRCERRNIRAIFAQPSPERLPKETLSPNTFTPAYDSTHICKYVFPWGEPCLAKDLGLWVAAILNPTRAATTNPATRLQTWCVALASEKEWQRRSRLWGDSTWFRVCSLGRISPPRLAGSRISAVSEKGERGSTEDNGLAAVAQKHAGLPINPLRLAVPLWLADRLGSPQRSTRSNQFIRRLLAEL